MTDFLYRKVYDPNGVPFEVGPERAAQLVLNKGWSNTPPQPTRSQKRARKRIAPVEVAIIEPTTDDKEVSPEPASGPAELE